MNNKNLFHEYWVCPRIWQLPYFRLLIDGKEVTSKFESLAPFEPFGLYVPSVLERYDVEDGVEFEYDTRNLITIGPYSQFAVKEADLKKTYEAIVPFAEYIGSQPEGGDNPAILTDFFAFEHEGTRYGIRFRYGKDDAATAVPRFLETIRTLKLVTEMKWDWIEVGQLETADFNTCFNLVLLS